MSAISSLTRAKVRQQAIRRMCRGPNGELTKDALVIIAMLRGFCDPTGRLPTPLARGTGAVDTHAVMNMNGRREVFNLLARMLNVTIEDTHKLEDPLT